MQVQDLFSSPVYALRPDDSVFHARSEMIARSVSKLPVVEGERVVGMLTKSDIVFASDYQTPPGRRKPLAEVPVSNLMSQRVTTAEPGDDVGDVVRRMASRNISGVPVVEDDRCVGILTESDVLRHVTDEIKGRYRVEDLMTADPVTVHVVSTIPKAIQAMTESSIHQLPVLQDEETLVGILTMSDIVFSFWFEEGPPEGKRIVTTRRDEPGRTDREKEVQGLVRDAFTEDPETTSPDRSIADATHALVTGGFNALPVVEDGRLAGVVTRTDVIRRWAGYD